MIYADNAKRGVTCARCRAALASSCLLDHQGWFQRDGIRNVVDIGRVRHHRLMDLGELRLGAITLDADSGAQALVARRDRGIDPEETPEVDLAFGLDLQLFEGDPSDGALRHISHRHTGVERGDQVFLGVGEGVAAAQFAGFVDVKREAARYLFAAYLEARDLGTASGLALPGRGDTPVGFALGCVLLDTGAQCHEIIDVDAVDDSGLGRCYGGVHDTSPVPG